MNFTLFLLVYCLCCLISTARGSEYVNIPEGEGNFRSRVCGDVGTESTAVELSCPNNTWFHVLHKLSSLESVDNCSALTLPGTNALIERSDHSPPLTPECRGRQTVDSSSQLCNETIQVSSKYNASEVKFFEVKYECINDSLVYNMCDDVSEEITSGDVHLASPSFYPSATAASSDVNCSCRLTTMDSFTAHALYLSQRDVWNMTCETCSITFQNQYVTYPVVNEVLFQDTTQNQSYELDIKLWNNIVDNELWINFTGGSTVHLQCNGGLDITTTQAATATTADNSATAYTSTATDTTTTGQTSLSTSTSTTTTSSSTGVSTAETTAVNTSAETKQTTNTEASSSSDVLGATNTTAAEQTTPETSDQSNTSTTTSNTTGIHTASSAVVTSSDTRQTTTITDTSSFSGGLEDTYIVVGVVVGVVLITVLFILIICFKKKRRRQDKTDFPKHPMESLAHVTSSDRPAPPRPGSDNYCDIDLIDDADDDTRIPPYSDEAQPLPSNGHKPRDIAIQIQPDSQLPSQDQQRTLFLKPVVEPEHPDQAEDRANEGNATGQHTYFILEPDPTNKKERGVLFLTDTQGRDLHQDGFKSVIGQGAMREDHTSSPAKDIGTLGQASLLQHENEPGRDSNPYYSQIKEIDYSLTNTIGKVPERNVKSTQRLSDQRELVSDGDYEEVGFDSDEDTQQAPTPWPVASSRKPSRGLSQKPRSASPSTLQTPGRGDVDDEEELIMVDNALYESADTVLGDVRGTNTHPRNAKDADDDDDELVMVDNVAYESADNILNDVRRMNCHHQDNDVDEDDDKLIMIDNAVYESADSLQKADSRQQRPDVNDDDECFMIDNILYESSDTLGLQSPTADGKTHTSTHPRTHDNSGHSTNTHDTEDDDEYVTLDNGVYESASALGEEGSRRQTKGNDNQHTDEGKGRKTDATTYDVNDNEEECVMIENELYESSSGLGLVGTSSHGNGDNS